MKCPLAQDEVQSVAEVWNAACQFEMAAVTPSRKVHRRRSSSRRFASASVAMSESVMPKASGSFTAPPPKPKVGACCGFGLLGITYVSLVFLFG